MRQIAKAVAGLIGERQLTLDIDLGEVPRSPAPLPKLKPFRDVGVTLEERKALNELFRMNPIPAPEHE